MANIFNSILVKKPGSSKQNLSHTYLGETTFGRLVPVLYEDMVPGDRIRTLGSEVMVKFQPILAPLYARMNCRIDYFFVPYRLLWDGWTQFISPGSNIVGDHTTDPQRVMPTIGIDTFRSFDLSLNSLADYFGLPVDYVNDGITYQAFWPDRETVAFPFSAYNMIWNFYYRNQSLQEDLPYKLVDGRNDNVEFCKLRYKNWERDYFTAALPWSQKSLSDVQIPFTGRGPVNYKGSTDGFEPTWVDGNGDRIRLKAIGNNGAIPSYSAYGQANTEVFFPQGKAEYNPGNSLEAEITSGGITVNELRRLTNVQHWLEVAATAGSRYKESILALFGVHTPDYRLDQPEYLGGGVIPVVVNTVLQNSESTENSPLGNYAGYGIARGYAISKKYRVEEHGCLIGIASFMPRSQYSQGFPRAFAQKDITDYYFPQFQHLGEQELHNYELYAYQEQGLKDTFGYLPRYAEKKYHPSTIHGNFRTNLSYWHMGRLFSARPSLNEIFVSSENSQERQKSH